VSALVTCPSGLAGRVRGLRVKEEQILTDRQLAKSGGQIDALLAACWEETTDPGPYGFDGKPDWSQVLIADRFVALVHIRMATYGPTYAFDLPCERCGERIEWELELDQLPVRELSVESRSTFLAANRFRARLPEAGRDVRFRLLVGDDERKLPQLQQANREKVLSASLAHRVVEIDGVAEKDRRAFLEDLTLGDVKALLTEVERVDGGIETTVDIQCPSCQAVQAVDLPFQGTFLLPTGKGSAGSSRR
jgi:hypothetical protein